MARVAVVTGGTRGIGAKQPREIILSALLRTSQTAWPVSEPSAQEASQENF